MKNTPVSQVASKRGINIEDSDNPRLASKMIILLQALRAGSYTWIGNEIVTGSSKQARPNSTFVTRLRV